MKPVLTIAKYTAVEAFRDKFVWFIFAFMLFGVPLGIFIKNLTLYGTETVMPSVVIDMSALSVSMVSVLYVNIATRRELDGRIMLVILSKPVSNMQYLLGKLVGFWVVAAVYVVSGAVLIRVLGIASTGLALKFVYASLLLHMLVTAWSLFFALLLNSLPASVMISSISWVLFNVIQTLWEMADNSGSALVNAVGKIFYYIMPNYQRFDLKHAMLYGANDATNALALLAPYALIYTMIIIIFAWLDFSKKEY